MTRTKLVTALAALGAVGLLGGCGSPETQDNSSNNNNIATGVRLTGTVVDGYVARGIVWVDKNLDGELNIALGEPFAFTDNDGNYSKGYGPDGIYGASVNGANGIAGDFDDGITSDDVAYCDAYVSTFSDLLSVIPGSYTVTDADFVSMTNAITAAGGVPYSNSVPNPNYDRNLCLTGNFTPDTEYTLRLEKGYDLTTGEPFHGTLTSKATTDASGNLPLVILSPLTTLTANMSAAEKDQLAASLGITAADLDSDFLNPNATIVGDDATGTKRKQVIAAALQVQKFAEVATKNLDSAAGANAPNNTSDLVFKAIAEQVVANAGNLDNATTGAGATAAITAAATKVSTAAGTTVTAPAGTDTAASQVSSTTKSVITGATGADVNAVLASVKQGARAVQVVANVAASTPNSAAVTTAANLAADPAFVAKLDDTADLSDVTSGVSGGTVTSSADVDYSARPCIAKNYGDWDNDPLTADDWVTCGDKNIVGQQVVVRGDVLAGPDLILGTADDVQDYTALAFLADPKDTTRTDQGVAIACVNFASDPNSDYQVSHKAFAGTWKRLSDYAIVLDMVFVGGNPDAMIVKSIKDIDTDISGTKNPGDQWRMTVDYGGELNTWDATLPATGGFLEPANSAMTYEAYAYQTGGEIIPAFSLNCGSLFSTAN